MTVAKAVDELVDSLLAMPWQANTEKVLPDAQKLLLEFMLDKPLPLADFPLKTVGAYPRYALTPDDCPLQVILILWPPGTKSSIHAHENNYGIVGVYEGRIAETKYELQGRSDLGVALTKLEPKVFAAGTATLIRPNDQEQIHRVESPTEVLAATIDVFFGRFEEIEIYAPTDTKGVYNFSRMKLWRDIV